MSHVAEVTVWRCGLWLEGWCRGTEYGCGDSLCAEARANLEEPGLERTLLTHGEFLHDYGRCPTGPHGCRVAEQLPLLSDHEPTAGAA